MGEQYVFGDRFWQGRHCFVIFWHNLKRTRDDSDYYFTIYVLVISCILIAYTLIQHWIDNKSYIMSFIFMFKTTVWHCLDMTKCYNVQSLKKIINFKIPKCTSTSVLYVFKFELTLNKFNFIVLIIQYIKYNTYRYLNKRQKVKI